MGITRFSLLIMTIALLIGQVNAANMNIAPSNKTVIQGETFDLNVIIDPQGTAIAGAQLKIAFDKSIVKVNDIKEGNLFKQSGAPTFFNGGTINNSSGTVTNIFDAIIGKANVTSPGTFVVINMTAIGASGTSFINLSDVGISDPNGIVIVLNVTNGSVSINTRTISINTPPILAAIGNKTVKVGQTLTFILSATDADGDVLTYSASNLPSGALFNPATRIFQWTPNRIGTYSNVHFEVSDGTFIDFENITISVSNAKNSNNRGGKKRYFS